MRMREMEGMVNTDQRLIDARKWAFDALWCRTSATPGGKSMSMTETMEFANDLAHWAVHGAFPEPAASDDNLPPFLR